MTRPDFPSAVLPSPGLATSFWARIANELAGAIGQGVYAPGDRLPSEHQLAEQFGVNRHTIRRSLASLIQRGLVRASRGSGTYVEEFAVDLAIGKRSRHRQSLAQAGLRGSLKVVSSALVCAGPEESTALRVRRRSGLLHLQILGDGANQPLHVSDRYFPLPRFARMEELVRDSGSITQAFLEHGITDYSRLESRISARLPSPETAAFLKQPVTRPVMLVTSVNLDGQGVPIEFASTWFAGDRVTLTVKHDEV
jgi:GntR family phosphonate transport system transcriptional regulator